MKDSTGASSDVKNDISKVSNLRMLKRPEH